MGHLASRARISGVLSLCLLLSSLGATGALAGAAPPQTAAPHAAALVFGTNSCVGIDACTNAVGPIGDDACIGDYSCTDTAGSIGSDSCVGAGNVTTLGRCTGATGNIGVNSCNGERACLWAFHDVGDNSCNASSACRQSSSDVGNDSCNGQAACWVGDGSTSVGNHSCNGLVACQGVFMTVGDNSCNGDRACDINAPAFPLSVGDKSCNGSNACQFVEASIGNYSCNGAEACLEALIAVGDCANNVAGSVPAECVQPDAQIRRGSGSYVGDNIYFPQFQGVGNNGVVGQKLTFFILLDNDGFVPDRFRVKRSGFFNAGFRVRYYDTGNNDVTGQVNVGTFTTPLLSPGAAYVLRATVKVRPQAVCLNPVQRTMTATSINANVKDEVTFAAGLICLHDDVKVGAT